MEDENDTNHSDRENDRKLLGGNQLAESRLATEKIPINGLSELAEGNSSDKHIFYTNYKERKFRSLHNNFS